MRFAEAARAAPGEHLGATKGKAAVVELPHIHSLLRDVWKIDQDCVGFAGGAGDRKLSILKGPSPLFGREPSLFYWLRVFRFSRLEESIEKANLREGNLDQGDFEIFCALNLDFVVEPTCGIGAQMRPSRKGIGC